MSANRNLSIVEYMSQHEGYSCGYCKSSDTNYSHGLWAHTMTVGDYQDLIDRGWRRSGKYCYKPTMNLTCCPQYTIKCDTSEFKLSKSQKNVLKKLNKYLNTGEMKEDKGQNTALNDLDIGPSISEVQTQSKLLENKLLFTDTLESDVKIDEISEKQNSERKKVTKPENNLKLKVLENEKVTPKAGLGADPNKPPCKKAKILRQERREQKKSSKTHKEIAFKQTNCTKTIEDHLNASIENGVHKLEILLIPSHTKSNEFKRTLAQSHQLYTKYQQIVHNDPPSKCTLDQYMRFLVNSPLEHENGSNGFGYGSFHQQYWLDGKLIGVGVIDILPRCVSSVYFYYDPDYRFLTLGTYASLQEIAFTRELSKKDINLKYYYLGFYIHSCVKMRYKGQYNPSFLLCPEVYSWHSFDDCKPKLDRLKYTRLNEDKSKVDENIIDVQFVRVFYRRIAMPYSVFVIKRGNRYDDEYEVIEYSTLVGGQCARRMLLFRQ